MDLAAEEADIRVLWDEGELGAAATRIIEVYGPEVLGFLIATQRDEERGSEAFAMASAALWQGLGAFRWSASLRTWFYTLARHAVARLAREKQRRREVPLEPSTDVVARVRTRTLAHLRSEVKDRFAALREKLAPEDQTLLILRVDRGLDWIEVARVFSDEIEPGEEDLARVSARLRKRFQVLKEELNHLARASGLLADDS